MQNRVQSLMFSLNRKRQKNLVEKCMDGRMGAIVCECSQYMCEHFCARVCVFHRTYTERTCACSCVRLSGT